MSSKAKGKVQMEAKDDFGSSPFSSLSLGGLPEASRNLDSAIGKESKLPVEPSLGSGERLEVRREKSGRGGKTVTTVCGFPSCLGLEERNRLLKRMKSNMGTGGTWNRETMELQGDRRNEVVDWLRSAGFKPVLAGG